MNRDLFDNPADKPTDPAEDELRAYDLESFSGRLTRLREINLIYSFEQNEFGSDESVRIFDEAIQSYVFGHYVATIILSQAFVERRFQEFFNIRFDDKRAKYTLNEFIKEFKGTGFLPDYIFEKIDRLRLKRNPFIHHRPPTSKDTLMTRSMDQQIHPDTLLQKDAKDAIELMIHMSRHRIL